MEKMRISKGWLSLLALIMLTLSACAPVHSTPTTSSAGELVIYSGRSENLVGPLIEQFKATSGINVVVRYGSTPELAATLLEEGANSPADLFFAQDPGGLGALANAGLLASLPEALVNRVKPGFRAPDGAWVGVAGRARVVVYNTDSVTAAELPADIADFTDPVWAGRIGWAPTNASFQAMVTGMRVLWGEAKTRAWLEGIQANEPVVFEGNAPIVEAVGAGEVAVGFVNHYYLHRFLAEQGDSFPARNHFLPSGGPGSLVMVAGVGQLAAGKNGANALAFIDYLLSPAAQQYFVEQTNEYPVIEGIAVPSKLTPLEELNTPDIALTDLADLQGTTRLLQATGVLP